jgi:hypothetical protein
VVTEEILFILFTFSHYFFLYPVGHLGIADVTFLVVLPLTQVIVVFLIVAGAALGAGEVVLLIEGLP